MPHQQRLAVKVGVDVGRYRECMASDRPKKTLDAHAAEARAAGLEESVPVFFIGPKLFHGAKSAKTIRTAIDQELARR